MKLLLSPHNDDEALFASYLCLREKPRVLVALDGGLKKNLPDPIERVAESANATGILGCDFDHLGFPCAITDWTPVEERLRQERDVERVWVPMPEPNGHRHHNRLAQVALRIWGADLVSFYSTYRVEQPSGWPIRTTHGHTVATAEGWDELKRRALDCYQTQIQSVGTRMHFERPLDEYEAARIRLNLAGGINPIDGYTNLDKKTGWTFEAGLADYPDGSVEAVTESHALMYVPLHLWPDVFAEIARVLEPGGIVRITEDAIGCPGSQRPVIRPAAAVATTPELILEHLTDAGLDAHLVDPDETGFNDRTLIQQNYGQPPDVFHTEAAKPGGDR